MFESIRHTISGWFHRKPPENVPGESPEPQLTQTPTVTSEVIAVTPSKPTKPHYKRHSHGDKNKRNRHRAEKEVKEFLDRWNLCKQFRTTGNPNVCLMTVRRWPGPMALKILEKEYGFTKIERAFSVITRSKMLSFNIMNTFSSKAAKQTAAKLADQFAESSGGLIVDA